MWVDESWKPVECEFPQGNKERKGAGQERGGGFWGLGGEGSFRRLLGNQGEPCQRKVTAELVESDDVILMSVS